MKISNVFSVKDSTCHTKPNEGSPTSKFKKSLAILTLGMGLHCGLTALGILGASACAIHYFCNHGEEPSVKLNIERLHEIPSPDQCIQLGEITNAEKLLISAQPDLEKIKDFKLQEALEKEKFGEPFDGRIKVSFFIDTKTNDACAVICKKGFACPCAKPFVYKLGSMTELNLEGFPGQKEIIFAISESLEKHE